MISNRSTKSIHRLMLNKENTLAAHRSIIELLNTSGFTEYLRSRGTISAYDPSSDVVTQANKGSFCAGYNACLDDLINFVEEIVMPIENTGKMPVSSYGAHEAMRESNRFTPEELEKIKNTPI